MSEESLVYRLRKRAEIRGQIAGRKSVQEGKPDRLAALLEEAADEIDRLHLKNGEVQIDSIQIEKDYLEINWIRPNFGFGQLLLRRTENGGFEFDTEFMGPDHARQVLLALIETYPLRDVPSK